MTDTMHETIDVAMLLCDHLGLSTIVANRLSDLVKQNRNLVLGVHCASLQLDICCPEFGKLLLEFLCGARQFVMVGPVPVTVLLRRGQFSLHGSHVHL